MTNFEIYTERIRIKPRRNPKKRASWVILKLPIENNNFPLGKSKLKNIMESKSIKDENKFFRNFLELNFLFFSTSNSISWFAEKFSDWKSTLSQKRESYQIEFFTNFWVKSPKIREEINPEIKRIGAM